MSLHGAASAVAVCCGDAWGGDGDVAIDGCIADDNDCACVVVVDADMFAVWNPTEEVWKICCGNASDVANT